MTVGEVGKYTKIHWWIDDIAEDNIKFVIEAFNKWNTHPNGFSYRVERTCDGAYSFRFSTNGVGTEAQGDSILKHILEDTELI